MPVEIPTIGLGVASSPVLDGGRLFLQGDVGRGDGSFLRAPPVAYSGRLLLASEEGETFVVKAGERHEVWRVKAVGEAVSASPALADGRV